MYTYLQGDEYEDISAAWDWNKIPGTTVDFGATPLNCDQTRWTGVEAFVGGASDGTVGIAAMRYTNPLTQALRWQKAWFFLEDDVQHVMISIIASSNAPVFSILDQKRHKGPVIVDGLDRGSGTLNISSAQSLWHDHVGYMFPSSDAFELSLDVGIKTGDWSAIGTSPLPPANVDLFAAWINHHNVSVPVSYSVFPATNPGAFIAKSSSLRLQSIQNDANVSAVYDRTHKTAFIVFWDVAGGSVHFTPSPGEGGITIASSGNTAVIYHLDAGVITVSDPSQTLTTVQITLTSEKAQGRGNNSTQAFSLHLPSGGLAGSSVSQAVPVF